MGKSFALVALCWISLLLDVSAQINCRLLISPVDSPVPELPIYYGKYPLGLFSHATMSSSHVYANPRSMYDSWLLLHFTGNQNERLPKLEEQNRLTKDPCLRWIIRDWTDFARLIIGALKSCLDSFKLFICWHWNSTSFCSFAHPHHRCFLQLLVVLDKEWLLREIMRKKALNCGPFIPLYLIYPGRDFMGGGDVAQMPTLWIGNI